MNLGDRLRLLRDKHGLTQLALAEKLNMPNQNISNYERGFRQPDYETLQRFAEFYEVSTDYLITGKEKKETATVKVAGQEIELTEEEYMVFQEMKKHPSFPDMLKDLSSNPERKVKKLIQMWELIKPESE